MSNLAIFQIIAGIASILAFLFTLYTTLKPLREFKQKQLNAEKELESELDRLQAAGGTVSARTDLGFFVIIELASLRHSIILHRHRQTRYLVYSLIFLIIRESIHRLYILSSIVSFVIDFVFVLIIVGCLINVVVNFIHVERLIKYTESYERRIKEVWQRPIDKRLKHKDNRA